jgi:hypothetical protein
MGDWSGRLVEVRAKAKYRILKAAQNVQSRNNTVLNNFAF